MLLKHWSARNFWALLITAVVSLCIFAVTFLTYFEAHRNHLVVGYNPAIFGSFAFFVSMTLVGYWVFVEEDSSLRFAKALGAALVETIAFCFLLLFLLLNTLGS